MHIPTRHVGAPTQIASVGLWLVLLGSASSAQIKERLTGADIDHAIQSGIAGDVAPFPLYPSGLGEKSLAAGAPAPALAYTPFVRVALQAGAAYDRGIVLTPTDIGAAALEPVVYVAFTIRACCGEREKRITTGPLTIRAVFDPHAARTAATAARVLENDKARPLWLRASMAPLRELGIQPPEHVEAIAAFPVDVVTAAKEFRIGRLSPDRVSGVFGFFSPVHGDTRGWR
jgi:hypothetical protein